ncbi:citrate transporter [Ramlibacter sp.]|uniref:citrate transporter n=1 Tax=Ramlibacter sp. TaxID=1917967 RepID=UPI00261DE2F0|nr:citrate transporter [Ramlibacter sp.]
MSLAGIPIDFVLFAFTLLGVALLHHHTLAVAVSGMVAIALYKLLFGDFAGERGARGLVHLLGHEWVTLANLLGLLLGFALLADHFERSRMTELLPRILPDDWRGGFVLLLLIALISSFLDNIAAAMIGGAMAHVLYRGRVHIGFLAAIVAASNAGGAGSVVGDTTTTMMWIAGVRPKQVFEAYVGGAIALLFFAGIAARQQQAYQPIMREPPRAVRVDFARLAVVALMLLAAIATNIDLNLRHPELLAHWPVIGLSVWVALLATAGWRAPSWHLLPGALRGSLFLLSLVLCAAMMPVKALPAASWASALGLGFISAVFDNIPLTALALRQGGHDWGFLAFAVGFGGSMVWFGSSAGVALCTMYPEGRSVLGWLKGGWHVVVAYLLGFAAMMLLLGWAPDEPAARKLSAPSVEAPAPVESLPHRKP